MRTWKKIALTAAAVAALALFLLWRAGGVIMTAEYKEYPCGVQSVTCTMRNLSLSTAYYGAPFSVSVLRCGSWGPAYNSDAHVKFELWKKALPPLSSKTITYPVSIFKELDTPGKYHIQIEIERNGVREVVWCPFAIVE